jgi:hypothetical protein
MSEEAFDGWVAEMGRQNESTRDSERLTAEDYAVVINATSEDFGRGPDIIPPQPHEGPLGGRRPEG